MYDLVPKIDIARVSRNIPPPAQCDLVLGSAIRQATTDRLSWIVNIHFNALVTPQYRIMFVECFLRLSAGSLVVVLTVCYAMPDRLYKTHLYDVKQSRVK